MKAGQSQPLKVGPSQPVKVGPSQLVKVGLSQPVKVGPSVVVLKHPENSPYCHLPCAKYDLNGMILTRENGGASIAFHFCWCNLMQGVMVSQL